MNFDKVLELLADIKSGKITVDDALRIVAYLKDFSKPLIRTFGPEEKQEEPKEYVATWRENNK